MSNKKRNFKVVDDKKSVADERTPKEYFDEAKAGLITIANSYEKNALRIDNVFMDHISIKKDYDCEFGYAIEYAKIKKDTYKKIVKILEKITFDSMSDFDNDPFIDFIYYVDDKISLNDAFDKYAVFEAVRPFGEKVESLKLMLKEMQEK